MKIFTAGYGNRKPDDFVALLRDAGITTVIDVRLTKGAYLSCYQAGDNGMAALLAGRIGEPTSLAIEYVWAPELGKPKEMALSDYDELVLNTTEGGSALWLVRWYIKRRDAVCLVCCERDACKDGKVNCHRVYVADVLVKQLGDGWEVGHL